MACDLFCWQCACFCFVWALLSYCHVLSCLLSWPRPSCYLIIGSVAPPVVPHYPPHLLPIYSSCVLCQFVVICSLVVFWSCPALPCPALPCPALPCLPSLSNYQLSFFPHGAVFLIFLLLLQYHLLHYWVLASSRTSDSYENVRLRCSCNFHITDKKNSANIKKPGRFESLHNIKNNIVIRSIQYQRECLSYVCIISKKKYHNIKYGCFKHRGNIYI